MEYCQKSGIDNFQKILKLFFLILFLLLSVLKINSQVVTWSVKNIRLSDALEQISKQYNARFAFDPEKFAGLKGNIDISTKTIGEFLDYFQKKFPVKVNEIEGTYIFTIDEERIAQTAEKVPALYRVSGYVADRQTGEKLRYCNIGWENGRGTITNDLGFFTFETNQGDSLILSASFLGYERLDTLIFPISTMPLRLELKPFSQLIPEIMVVENEHKVLQFTNESGRVAFDPSKAGNVAGIDENDLMNALSLVPGINFMGGQSGGLSIRGGSPSENLVLIDGIPVFESNHIFGNMSLLNGKYIQQVFVSRGGFDASDGERVSGLIELNGRSAMRSGPLFDASANLLNSNLMGVIPLSKKVSVSAAWRRSFTDWWQNYLFRNLLVDNTKAPLDESSSTQTEIYPTVRYDDLNLKFSVRPADNHEININMLSGNDLQVYDYYLSPQQPVYRNEKADGSNLGTSLNWSFQTGPAWHHYFTAGYSTYDRNTVDEMGKYTEVVDPVTKKNDKGKGKGLLKKQNVVKQKFTLDNSFNNLDELRFAYRAGVETGIFMNEAGIGWARDSFAYRYIAGTSTANLPVDSLNNKSQIEIWHFFVQQKIKIGQKLKFTWGMRANYDEMNREVFWQPRGGIEFFPVKNVKLQFLSGKYYQFLSQVRRLDAWGNMDLLWYIPQYEKIGLLNSNHYILGGQYDRKGLVVNVEAYRKHTMGKVNLFAEVYKKGTVSRIQYVTHEGQELSQGIDIFMHYRLPRWNHLLSYSFSRSEEKYPFINGGTWFPSFDDVTHRIRLGEIYNLKTWVFSGSWAFGSGLPDLAPSGSSWNKVTVSRLDYFSQVDVSVIKQFNYKDLTLSMGASVMNLFNRRNTLEVNKLRFASAEGALNIRSDLNAPAITPVFFINLKYQ